MTVTSAQVQTLLTDILGETTSTVTNAADLSSYTALSNLSTANTIATLAAQIAQDPEAGILQQVYRLYQAVLGRAPDAAGLQSWVAYAEQGLTSAQIHAGVSSVSQATWNAIINGFTASSEFVAKYNGLSGAALVELLYQNVLGRAPDPTGLATWTGILGDASVGAGATPAAIITVVNGIVNSAEFKTDTLANNTASTVAAAVADTGTGPTYTLTSVTAVGTITNLTTGIDSPSLTGSNNTVNGTANATGATYNVGDQIVGAANSSGNVLSLSDLSSTPVAAAGWNPTTLAGVTVSNFQTVNLVSGEQVSANVSSSSPAGFSGITTLNVTSISGQGNAAYVDNITAGATTAVNVNDTVGTTAVTGPLTVIGGSTVAITETNGTVGSAGGTITVNSGSATTSVSITQTEGAATKDAAFSITDTTSSATAAGTITSVKLNGLDTNGGTITDNSLSNLSVSNVVTGATINITANAGYAPTTPTTTLNLTVANDAATTVVDTQAEYTTLAITNAGVSTSTTSTPNNNSSVIFQDNNLTAITVGGTGTSVVTLASVSAGGHNFNSVASLTISGSTGLTETADFGTSTALKTVTDTSSGTVTLALNDTVASFDGSKGTGKQVITISQAATTAITGGTSGSNELIWNGAATPGASLTGTGGSISGFTTLGIGAAVVGTQAFDLSKLTGFTSIDVQGNTGTLTNLTVSKATGTSLSIDRSLTHAGTSSLVYSTADSAGATDTLNLALGTASAAISIDSLSLADSTGTGIGTLAVTSNGATTGDTNVITSLADTALSSLTVTGKASLSVGALTDNASSLTVTNNTTSTLQSSITATTASLTGLTIAGSDSAGTAVAISGDTAFGTFTLTDSATGPVTATLGTLTNIQALVLNDSSAAAEGVSITAANNATTLTVNNTGTALLTVAGGSENALATLAFTGTGAETISNLTSTYTATLAITDSDSSTVNLTAFTANSLANLSITDSGSGNLLVAQNASSTHAANIILANTGSGTLTVGTAGTDTNLTDTLVTGVTATGTGVSKLYLADTNTAAITVDFSGSSANDVVHLTHTEATGTGGTADVIKVGNGNNIVTLVDVTNVTTHTVAVTFGSGANTIDVSGSVHTSVDSFVQSANTGANSATAFTAITGAVSGDTLTFAGTGSLTIAAPVTTLTSVAAGITAGLATATGSVYTFTLGGNEYYFLHGDAGTALSSADSLVEVVGVTGTATISGHVLTLH